MTENPLHRLTRGQRRMLRVLHECGWRYALAAERLEMPEASVRTSMSRAMERAGVEDGRALAYWLGREDERNL